MSDKKLIMQKSLGSLLRKGVEHIMVINRNGRAESVFSKNKIILSKERQEVFFMGFRLHRSLMQEFDDEFGPVGCFVIHRGNAKLASVPFDSYNVVLIMNNDANHEFLINKIKEIVESCNSIMLESGPLCVRAISNG